MTNQLSSSPLPFKIIGIVVVSSLLLIGCGSDSNKKSSSSSLSSAVSSSASSEASSETSSEISSAASEVSSESSVSSSSSVTQVDPITADTTFSFAEGIEGWGLNGLPDSEPFIRLEHDAVNAALSMIPLDWSANAANNWYYQARTAFGASDLRGAKITVVLDVPAVYAGSGLNLQLVLQGAGYTDLWVGGPTAGENTIVWNVGAGVAGANDVTHFAVQLSSAPNPATILDPILIKSVEIDVPPIYVPSTASSVDFEDDAVGTTYEGTGWGEITATVASYSSLADIGLPANGSSNDNLLKVSVGNYHHLAIVSLAIPAGKTLADYDVHADIYFPVNSVGVSGDGDNGWKSVWLFAGTSISGNVDATFPEYQSSLPNQDYHDQWRTYEFSVDQAKAELLSGSIEIAIGIHRSGSAHANDVYYIDNISLVEK